MFHGLTLPRLKDSTTDRICAEHGNLQQMDMAKSPNLRSLGSEGCIDGSLVVRLEMCLRYYMQSGGKKEDLSWSAKVFTEILSGRGSFDIKQRKSINTKDVQMPANASAIAHSLPPPSAYKDVL
jgi:hypothetical protein